MMTPRSLLRIAAAAAGALLISACPDGTSPPAVAAVQMTSTNTNPRVGESTNLTAKAVNEGGVEIPGVACVFTSSNTAVATIDPTSGHVTTVSAGTAVMTATCGGKANTITITVRPRQFTLSITKTGAGSGAVFNTPAGTAFDEGTVVSVTATANAGSSFNGFTGACTGKTQPCSITMNADRTLTADFTDGELFSTAANFGGASSSVSDPSPPGCNYNNTFQATTFDLLVKTASVTGTSVSTITVTPTGGACTGDNFQVTATGTLTLTGNAINGTLVFFSNNKQKNTQTLTVSATRNNSTITGTVSLNQKLYNGAGTEFTSTGGPYAFTLNKVP